MRRPTEKPVGAAAIQVVAGATMTVCGLGALASLFAPIFSFMMLAFPVHNMDSDDTLRTIALSFVPLSGFLVSLLLAIRGLIRASRRDVGISVAILLATIATAIWAPGANAPYVFGWAIAKGVLGLD